MAVMLAAPLLFTPFGAAALALVAAQILLAISGRDLDELKELSIDELANHFVMDFL